MVKQALANDQRGAENPNTMDWFGRTPLMIAARNGHHEVVLLLLEHGADASLKGPWGGTALSHARDGGHLDVAELLQAWEEESNHQSALENYLTKQPEQALNLIRGSIVPAAAGEATPAEEEKQLLGINVARLKVAIHPTPCRPPLHELLRRPASPPSARPSHTPPPLA